jgi:hypothetical protein
VVVPWIVAANCNVPPVVDDAAPGEIVTEVTAEPLAAGGGTGGAVGADAAVTVTVAEPDSLVSSALVAVTTSVPALAGAV